MLSAEKIAELLGLALPQDASPAEVAEWAEWWRESAELAQNMPPEHVAYRQAGGWWPPATSRQANEIAPMVVRYALRPGMGSKTDDDAA